MEKSDKRQVHCVVQKNRKQIYRVGRENVSIRVIETQKDERKDPKRLRDRQTVREDVSNEKSEE